MNVIAHTVTVEDGQTVETVGQLREALSYLSTEGDHLDRSYRVELLCERLSDHSVVYSVRLRETEDVR